MAFPQFDNLRHLTKQWLEETKTTQVTLSKMLSLASRSALSEFLSGDAGISATVYQKLVAIVTPEPPDPNQGCRIVNLQVGGKNLRGVLKLEREDLDDIIKLSRKQENEAIFGANQALRGGAAEWTPDAEPAQILLHKERK
jgi:hypothetical protein